MSLAELYEAGLESEERAYVARFTAPVKCPVCGSAGHVTPSERDGFFCFRCNVEWKGE